MFKTRKLYFSRLNLKDHDTRVHGGGFERDGRMRELIRQLMQPQNKNKRLAVIHFCPHCGKQPTKRLEKINSRLELDHYCAANGGKLITVSLFDGCPYGICNYDCQIGVGYHVCDPQVMSKPESFRWTHDNVNLSFKDVEMRLWKLEQCSSHFRRILSKLHVTIDGQTDRWIHPIPANYKDGYPYNRITKEYGKIPHEMKNKMDKYIHELKSIILQIPSNGLTAITHVRSTQQHQDEIATTLRVNDETGSMYTDCSTCSRLVGVDTSDKITSGSGDDHTNNTSITVSEYTSCCASGSGDDKITSDIGDDTNSILSDDIRNYVNRHHSDSSKFGSDWYIGMMRLDQMSKPSLSKSHSQGALQCSSNVNSQVSDTHQIIQAANDDITSYVNLSGVYLFDLNAWLHELNQQYQSHVLGVQGGTIVINLFANQFKNKCIKDFKFYSIQYLLKFPTSDTFRQKSFALLKKHWSNTSRLMDNAMNTLKRKMNQTTHLNTEQKLFMYLVEVYMTYNSIGKNTSIDLLKDLKNYLPNVEDRCLLSQQLEHMCASICMIHAPVASDMQNNRATCLRKLL